MKTVLLLVAHCVVLAEAANVGNGPARYDYRGGIPGIGRDVSAVTETVSGIAPVGVGADYAYFASQLGQDPLEMYGLYSGPLSAYRDQPQNHQGPVTSQNSGQFSPLMTTRSPVRQTADLVALLSADVSVNDPGLGGGMMMQYQPQETTTLFLSRPQGQSQEGSNQQPQPPAPPTSTPAPVPQPQQQVMTNLFIAGVDRAGDFKQFFHPDVSGVGSDKVRGTHPIPGLNAPVKSFPNVASGSGPPHPPLRSPCDPLVDVVFALDDAKKLWMARDAIRNYVTQLRPQAKARFGVVLCGERHSFYTALHQHFSGLLASLEDLQHANVTIDVTFHMPDTPGTRSDNNPYPPSVSEDFSQTTAMCLETAYFMFMYQAKDHSEKLLALIPTKERWGRPEVLEEARYLQTFNISLLVLADGALSTPTLGMLRSLPTSPDGFRVISDSVTLHALPAIISDAICRPQKADVTIPVQRTSTTQLQNFRVLGCQQINSTAMARIVDFGHHFGHQKEVIRCAPGMSPDPSRCECRGL